MVCLLAMRAEKAGASSWQWQLASTWTVRALVRQPLADLRGNIEQHKLR
jgi:hypothetical protein